MSVILLYVWSARREETAFYVNLISYIVKCVPSQDEGHLCLEIVIMLAQVNLEMVDDTNFWL